MRTTLFKYQRQGLRLLFKHKGRALLGDEMGLGKTIQALAYAWANSDLRPVVIVCPAHLKYNWEDECRIHLGIQARVLSGRKASKFGLTSAGRFIIINYDILKDWVDVLKKLKPGLIVIDEAQYIKNISSQRSRCVRRLCKGVKNVIALSGTFITKSPVDFWPVLNILWPKVFPSFHPFAFKYTNPRKTHWGWQFRGSKNEQELYQELLKLGYIRRLKKDVLKQLPDKQHYVVALPLTNEKEYVTAEQDFITWLKKQSLAKAKRAAKAIQFVKQSSLQQLAAAGKLKAIITWIEDWLESTAHENGKLIVFAIHTKIIRALHEHFKNQAVMIDGSVHAKKRHLCIDKFTRHKTTRLVIAQLQAAGTGWNGTAASAVLHTELPFVPADISQANDRAHRIGQKRKVACYYAVAHNTIEEDQCKTIQQRQKANSAILDGNETVNALNIHDQVAALTLRRYKK